MRLSLILLFLQLWGDVQVASSQSVTCSTAPAVAHASVSEDTQKAVYSMGDVIHYTCDVGYVSFPTTRYICSSNGWVALHQGKCTLKPCELPDDIPHGYYEFIHGDSFVFGATIRYFCNEGYHMVSKEDTRTCMLDRWTNRSPVCDPLSCDPPPVDEQLTVTGLPDNNEPILPDRFLRFSCDVRGTQLNGSSMLICGKDGQWDHPFPNCEEITCKPGTIHSHLIVDELPANQKVKVGQRLRFQCRDSYSLDGDEEIQCLPSGTWSSPFPTCAEKCKVPQASLRPGVRITNHVPTRELKIGQSLQLACSNRRHYLRGNKTLTCLAGGQWSDLFPTCGDPLDCERPPGLDNGDTKFSVQYQNRHGAKVEYVCQNLYTLEGGPYKTCINGEWIGEIRCLKPCIVDQDVKRTHNLDFRYSSDGKMYAAHNDHLTFSCIRGTRHDHRIPMRQQCVDGVMHLPTCH